jgi:hypothetical protein
MFAAKVLWLVDCFIQLFLEDCWNCPNQEDIDQRVIDLDGLNMDVILYPFHAILPPLFHKFNVKPYKNDDPRSVTRNGGKGKHKGGANGNEEEQRSGEKKLAKRIPINNQVKEFKMAKGKTWEGAFQGKCPKSQVKWMGTFMCPPPPPKNIEQNILGYVDCLKLCSLFLLIAQFNNNKRPPHNTSTTHNNNQNEPPLPYPQRLCPLIPWACQRRPQRMAPRLLMAPCKVPVIGFGRTMVGSLLGGAK